MKLAIYAPGNKTTLKKKKKQFWTMKLLAHKNSRKNISRIKNKQTASRIKKTGTEYLSSRQGVLDKQALKNHLEAV